MKDGIHRGLSINDYHGNKTHVSSSGLRHARRSLKEYWYYRQGLMVSEGSHFDFGNAFELALIDPKAFEKEVAIAQDSAWVAKALEEKPGLSKPRGSKAYQEASKQFAEDNQGKYIIQDKGKQSFETIEQMLTSCKADSVMQKLLSNTEYQVSVFWTDEETGLKCKARPDVCKLNKNVIVDVKTADDGSPEAFSKSLANHDYPFQACMQIDGCISSGLMSKVDKYFWLVVEKNIPYSATIYEFSEDDIRYCMDEYRYVKGIVKKALKQDKYPGYSQRSDNKFGILTAQIPLWYKTI